MIQTIDEEKTVPASLLGLYLKVLLRVLDNDHSRGPNDVGRRAEDKELADRVRPLCPALQHTS